MANSSEIRKQTATASLLLTKIYKTRMISIQRCSPTNLVSCSTQDNNKMAAGPLQATFSFLTIIHVPSSSEVRIPYSTPWQLRIAIYKCPHQALPPRSCCEKLTLSCQKLGQTLTVKNCLLIFRGSLLCFILWYNIKRVCQVVSRTWTMCAFVGKQSCSIYIWFIYQRISEWPRKWQCSTLKNYSSSPSF